MTNAEATELAQYARLLGLRFGQFLFNVISSEMPQSKDSFYVGDDELLEGARRYYEINKEYFGPKKMERTVDA